MNTWLKIKNKIYAEKLSEIDGLFSLIESNSSWSANLQSWASKQKFNKYNSLALSLVEYHEVNKNLTKINEELFYEFKNKEAVCSFKEEFKKYYKILLSQKENGLKLEVAAELVEDSKLSLEVLSAWYLENKHLPEKEFKETVGEFLGDAWKDAKRGGAYGALGGATFGGLSGGAFGGLGGAVLGGGVGGIVGGIGGAVGGGLYGGSKHLLNRFSNWQKTRNTPTSTATTSSGSSGGSHNYSTLRGGGRFGGGSSRSSKVESPPDYKNQTEFDNVKKEALAVLQKLKQYSTNLETDTNFHHLLDTIIEKLGGDKVPTATVPNNFSAQVTPPMSGSQWYTHALPGVHSPGGSQWDISSIHALPGATPAASAKSAKSAKPKPTATATVGAASSAAPVLPKPAAKPTGIPPKINDEKDVLDYLSVPDDVEMNKRLVKIGSWLFWKDSHEDYDDLEDKKVFGSLNQFLIGSHAYIGSASEIEKKREYGESYKKHLIHKLAKKHVAKTEPGSASTEPAVTSTTTSAMAVAPKPAKKKINDPHGFVEMPFDQFKDILIQLGHTEKGALIYTDKQIGQPETAQRKKFLRGQELNDEMERKLKHKPKTESFADKVMFYKEALRGF